MYRNFKINLEDKPLDQLMLFILIKTQEVQHKVSLSLSLFLTASVWKTNELLNKLKITVVYLS